MHIFNSPVSLNSSLGVMCKFLHYVGGKSKSMNGPRLIFRRWCNAFMVPQNSVFRRSQSTCVPGYVVIWEQALKAMENYRPVLPVTLLLICKPQLENSQNLSDIVRLDIVIHTVWLIVPSFTVHPRIVSAKIFIYICCEWGSRDRLPDPDWGPFSSVSGGDSHSL